MVLKIIWLMDKMMELLIDLRDLGMESFVTKMVTWATSNAK